MVNNEKYSIKIVSKLSCLSTYVIRAWERRYNAVSPKRTNSNRRYYTESDIQKLTLLRQATRKGFNIGSIAHFSVDDLSKLLQDNKSVTPVIIPGETNTGYPANSSGLYTGYVDSCLNAISKFDHIRFENLLFKAAAELNRDDLIMNLIIPLINEIGERWYKGTIRIANEHMASSVLIAFLHNLRSVYKNFQEGPVLISGTPQGQMHELGALIVAVTAASLGWKVVYLGANLPYYEILSAAENLQAKVICLSLVYPEEDNQTKHYLTDLRKMIPKEIKIIIGGRASLSYKDIADAEGLILIGDIDDFKQKLTEIKVEAMKSL